MKSIQVKAVMIPLSEYVSVKETDSLYTVFQTLDDGARSPSGRAHRDTIVVDDAGRFKGKITMIDIFRALEPNYQKLMADSRSATLFQRDLIKTIKEFNLWAEPLRDLCERGTGITVAQVMHIPDAHEFIQEEDSLEKALHSYVMGTHQPLVVRKGDTVTGILRFGDLFEVIRKEMMACPIN